MPPIRQHVVFTGRVQGVGFRWTVRQIAADHAATGWVRNETDGSVRCVLEGEEDEIRAVLDRIGEAMAGYIQNVEITDAEATGEFSGFSIRH